MWHLEIPKCRESGKIEVSSDPSENCYKYQNLKVIARNQLGEAYATTTLKLRKRRDDFRGILNKKESKCSKLIEKMILCTVHTGLNCQEFIERAEYRKPDWLVQMEMIKERLAGGASTFVMRTKIRLNKYTAIHNDIFILTVV